MNQKQSTVLHSPSSRPDGNTRTTGSASSRSTSFERDAVESHDRGRRHRVEADPVRAVGRDTELDVRQAALVRVQHAVDRSVLGESRAVVDVHRDEQSLVVLVGALVTSDDRARPDRVHLGDARLVEVRAVGEQLAVRQPPHAGHAEVVVVQPATEEPRLDMRRPADEPRQDRAQARRRRVGAQRSGRRVEPTPSGDEGLDARSCRRGLGELRTGQGVHRQDRCARLVDADDGSFGARARLLEDPVIGERGTDIAKAGSRRTASGRPDRIHRSGRTER